MYAEECFDKIIDEYKTRIEELETENSELRARLDKVVELPSVQKTTKFVWSISSGNHIEVGDYMILYPDKELDGYIQHEEGFNTEEEAKEALQKHLAEMKGK